VTSRLEALEQDPARGAWHPHLRSSRILSRTRPTRRARRHVVYLTPERAAQHTEPGTLHRVGKWKHSPALEAAQRLEAH
jgi:hypothetical protein